MSDQEIQKKLEDMKSIPSIFDIETHKPGESPNKPPPKMGQSPNIRYIEINCNCYDMNCCCANKVYFVLGISCCVT